MKKNILKVVFALPLFFFMNSCTDYLDVVPDNVATIDNAFAMRAQAEKFLFTCYSYMPHDADINLNPAILGGDELWSPDDTWAVGDQRARRFLNIAEGFQNIVNPYGGFYWNDLYRGIRDCNIFLENIEKVPDVEETEKRQWISEVKFLKAYYHFYLVRMYGPIPLIKENLPIDADVNEVQVFREPVDSCFSYITELIDEALEGLPVENNDAAMLGKITQPIALSLKAKVLVTAASPLFNGNSDQSALVNPDGTPLFNTEFSVEKWKVAADACRAAIDACHGVGMKLYTYTPVFQDLTDTITNELSIRNSVTEKWNSEIIWANTQSNVDRIQALAQISLDPENLDNTAVRGNLSPPLRIAEMFYTEHGVPIKEDNTWDYNNRYSLETADENISLYLKEGYTSAYLNFDREPRFYASLGFDGGVWYGQGKFDDNEQLYHVEAKNGQWQGKTGQLYGSVTGYWAKKLVNFENVLSPNSLYSVDYYPWPLMRLSGLYLLYAEALNEAEGPGPEVYEYVNLVRERAGLQSVQSSWSTYSNNPTKYTIQDGMREIIHQERSIELVFEGQRFWDIRRWKEATEKLNGSIKGWDLTQKNATNYYIPSIIESQTFGVKDYFWPIQEDEITRNRNLVQNLGW
jgi:hypothetical protein